MKIQGTLKELETIFSWEKLCKLIHVDYYKKYMIPSNEVFNVEIKLDKPQEIETSNLPEE